MNIGELRFIITHEEVQDARFKNDILAGLYREIAFDLVSMISKGEQSNANISADLANKVERFIVEVFIQAQVNLAEIETLKNMGIVNPFQMKLGFET